MPEVESSILLSVKKLLGLPREVTDFDSDVLMHINGAIFTLRQLGVGPKTGFTVTDPTQTYDDFLGEGDITIPDVRLYFFYKTKLGFDPPTSTVAGEVIKESIKEIEWRLRVEEEPHDVFGVNAEEVCEDERVDNPSS